MYFNSPIMLCFALLMFLPEFAAAQTLSTAFGTPGAITTPFVPVGTGSRRLRLVDFTGTSHPDIIRLPTGTASLEVVDLHSPASISVEYYPVLAGGDFDVGDLNNDGIIDAVVGNSGGITLVRSSPSGRLVTNITGTNVPVTASPYIVDINGNGLPDVLQGRFAFLQLSSGFFSTNFVPNHPATYDNTVPADFDGDGDIDLVVLFRAANGDMCLQFLSTTGPQTNVPMSAIVAIPFVTAAGALTATVEVADVDGDSVDDVVVWGGATTSNGVRVVRVYRGASNANLTLHSSFEYTGSSAIGRLLVRDVDGDGDHDLILHAPDMPSTLAATGSIVATLVNDGSGHFAPPVDRAFLTCNGVFTLGAMDIADLELDGNLWAVFHHGSATSAMPAGYARAMRQSSGTLVPTTLTQISPSGVTVLPQQPTILPLNSTVSINGNLTYAVAGQTRTGGGTFVQLGTNGSVLVNATLGTNLSLTSFLGSCMFPLDIGSSSGAVDITLSTASGLASSRHYGLGDANLTLVSGDLQTTAVGQMFPMPLTVRVTSTDGVPIPGTFVTVSTSGAPLTVAGGVLHLSDANGNATISVSAGSTPGMSNLTATILPSRSVTFSLMSFASIQPQGPPVVDVRIGETATVSVQVLSPVGQPVAGVPVTFSGETSFVSFTSNTSTQSDASGLASVTFVAGPASGVSSITALSPVGMTSAPVRVLGVSHLDLTAEIIGVRFVDIRPNLPLLIAFDMPQPQPLPTNVGVIHTSILQPNIYLQTLDGIGYFGFADPNYKTDPMGTWFQIFFVLPGLSGVTIVTQVYAFDVSQVFPHSVTVSNAVYRTF